MHCLFKIIIFAGCGLYYLQGRSRKLDLRPEYNVDMCIIYIYIVDRGGVKKDKGNALFIMKEKKKER